MTYTEDEIALARRGAKLAGFNHDDDGWWSASFAGRGWLVTNDDEELPDSPLLFVALLDKCDAEGIDALLSNDDLRALGWYACVCDGAGAKHHANRTLALMLALEAAGILPESTP